MTIKELLNLLKEQKKKYDEIEVYKYTSIKQVIHTDYIQSVEDYDETSEVEDYEIMDLTRYNESVLANTSYNINELFSNKDTLILVIIILT